MTNHDSWADSASCSRTDPNLWFPGRGDAYGGAVRICRRCPVQSECLHAAMANNEQWGIWGGLGEKGRKRLGRRLGTAAAVLAGAAIATSLATIAPTFADTTPAPISTGAVDVPANPTPAAPTVADNIATKPLLDPANANVPLKRPTTTTTTPTPPGPPATTPAGDAVKAWHAANDNAPVTGGAAAGPSCS